MNVSLGPKQEGYVRELVETGRYNSASEVVRTGLRLLEERETRLADLRQLIQEGVESGPSEPVDIEELKAAARKRFEGLRGGEADAA
jgi:antitoxin ParD1/3/4